MRRVVPRPPHPHRLGAPLPHLPGVGRGTGHGDDHRLWTRFALPAGHRNRPTGSHLQGACARMESLDELAAAIPDVVLEVPNRRNWFSLRLEDLPKSLAQDIENWLAREEGKIRRVGAVANQHRRVPAERHVAGTRRRRKPIRASTARSYRTILLSFITMEVKAGVPLENLQFLRDVVDLDHVDRGLGAYEQHFDGIKRRHLGQVMRVICVIAGHWVRVGEDQLAELRTWTSEVTSDARYGMSERTKEAVRALRDPRLLARLLTAPEEIFARILLQRPFRRSDAVRAQAAFATQFILNAPARIHNASRVHLGLNIRRIGTGEDQRVIIEYPAESVKNNLDLTYELSTETIRLLDLYLTRVRP